MRCAIAGTLFLLLVAPWSAGCGPQPATPTTDAETGTEHADTIFYQEATWSPDGSRILLSRLDIHDAYRASIAVVNADGSGYSRLTEGPGDMWASWSPDGAKIAYGSKKGDNRDIYVMDPDGSRPTRLTEDPAEDTHPDWSPDGTKLAFVSNREGLPQVYAMNADGSGQTRITDGPGEKWNPRWAPDGRSIVYYGAVEPGKDSVYAVQADGAEQRALGAGIWPSWSNDGAKLLYVADDDLYSMDADGTNPEKLLDDAVIARWSPDGERLAFIRVTWRAAEGWPAMSNLFVAQADGSGARRLTEH